RAVPKAETSEDVRGGVQKFRVKLLPEGAGSPMDVLCQVGLDGIRMLDPNTSRTLRIYPLETVTRWDVLDSSVFAFWSKSSVDLEARRIRLKSSSYTTNTILDTVTAASVQFKEMASSVSRSKAAADPASPSEQQNEKRRNFLDWRNLVKPVTEEKDHWVPDEAVNKCTACAGDFSAFNRRHHCRNCGDIFCDKCTQGRTPLTSDADSQPVRVCDRCMAEVSRRLSSAKEAANRPVVQSHEDLAKKLQEAMDINKKSSSGLEIFRRIFWQANAGGRMPHLHSPPPGAGPSIWLGDDRMRRLPAPFPRQLSLNTSPTSRSELFRFDPCQRSPCS
uniref:FYVE-type domain-containing protein n=1 Tax=Aegilops tauschii subsp. strangulata TaxID=200361 RepID=A0A453TA31_AEGTS